MTESSGNWCSDCAWPYDCAAKGSCFRRDNGEVRSVSEAVTLAAGAQEMQTVPLTRWSGNEFVTVMIAVPA